MTVLVTGANGFIGRYLTRLLHDKGYEVYGLDLDVNTMLEPLPEGNLIQCDIRSRKQILQVIEEIRPERVYHLAAQSFPSLSYKRPQLTMHTNVIGTINLYESLIQCKLKPKVLLACSASEYGYAINGNKPIKEDSFLKPLHPYGVSKVATELLGYQYAINYSIPTVMVRLFNITGPGKVKDACSDFSKRIASIELGIHPPPLIVGNLQSKRDITDVRDAVLALYSVLENGEIAEIFNLCCGNAYLMSDILRLLLSKASMHIKVKTSHGLLRPTDEPVILGDNSRLKQKTGWSPVINIKETLDDMLHYWRNTLQAENLYSPRPVANRLTEILR